MSLLRRTRAKFRRAPRVSSPALLAVLLWPALAGAQNYRARLRHVQEPQLLTFEVNNLEAGLDLEESHEETEFRKTGTRATYDRSYITPSISAGVDGSVYHPNFLLYSFMGKAAYGWGHQDIDTGTTVTHDDMQNLWSYRGDISLLPNKPLSGNANGYYERAHREYDFFTRSTVNVKGYGAETVYRSPALYSTLRYARTEDDTVDVALPYSSQQDALTWSAQNTRRHGSSSIDYNFTESRFSGLESTNDNRSTAQTISVSDGERFGRREQIDLESGAAYSRGDSDGHPDEEYSANVELGIAHRHNLNSSYDFRYDRYALPGYQSDYTAGQAALSHRLYDSLTSTLTLSGSDSQSSSGDQSGYARVLGGRIEENYTKRLGDDHRLQANASFQLNDVEQSSTGRGVNERHVFPVPPSIESFLLELPDVDENSVVVTDSGKLRQFVRGIDYELFPRGSNTEIRRISGGGIPEGSTVLVSYAAAPGTPGGYQTWTEQFGVRLLLWRDLWSVYGRMRSSMNNAAENQHVIESRDYISGTELKWYHYRAGAEYEVYDSDTSAYRATRLFESVWFRADAASSLSLTFSQTFLDNVDADRRERNYRYTLRYQRALTRRLHASADAGVNQHRGPGVDQDQVVVRPEIGYHIGQTSLKATYDYEYNLYLHNEERTKQQLLAMLTRRF